MKRNLDNHYKMLITLSIKCDSLEKKLNVECGNSLYKLMLHKMNYDIRKERIDSFKTKNRKLEKMIKAKSQYKSKIN